MVEDIQIRAENGDIEAQVSLGVLYELGIDRPQDFVKARKWFNRAAAKGHAWAKIKLSRFMELGIGSKNVDPFGAEQLRGEAARLGLPHRATALADFQGQPEDNENKPKVILVAPTSASEIEPMIRNIRCEPFCLTESQKIFNCLGKHPDVQLIILDFDVRGAPGPSLIRALKGFGIEIPILVVASNSDENLVREAKKLNLLGWMMRPFTESKFREVVNMVIQTEILTEAG